VPEGDVTIVYEFEVTGKPDIRNGKGAPGTGKLFVNGEQIGEVDIDLTVPLIFSAEGLSCGWDYGDSVDHEGYEPPFRFTGTINRVTVDLSGHAIQDAEAEMRRAMARQ
jgi:arylsulfatase